MERDTTVRPDGRYTTNSGRSMVSSFVRGQTDWWHLWLFAFMVDSLYATNAPDHVSMLQKDAATEACSSPLFVRDQADHNLLLDCASLNHGIYPGSVTFQDFIVPALGILDLSKITSIDGTLTFSSISGAGGRPYTIYAPNLTNIIDGLIFDDLKGLSSSDSWSALLEVANITFQNVEFSSSNFSMQQYFPVLGQDVRLLFDQTSVTAVEGYVFGYAALDWTQATFTNNRNLNLVNLTNIGKVSLTTADNGAQLHVSLPDLTGSKGLDIADATAFTADLLDTIASASFSTNQFSTLSLPKLISVDGNFSISENPSLTNLSIPELKSAQIVDLLDNPQLTRIELLALTTVSNFSLAGPVDR